MHAWQAIQKTLDYIELHIAEEIPTAKLAGVAALSPFYYQRLFAQLVKKPVREYIKLRRLASACEQLAHSDRRILDVALDCGFSSHETLTRAFRAAYGITPERYRQELPMLNQFDKPDLLLGYTVIDEGVPLISDGLVLEFRRHTLERPIPFVGVQGYVPVAGQMPLGESTGVDLPGCIWKHLHAEKHRIPRVPGGKELGVAFLGDAPAGIFTYFAGAEVSLPDDAQGEFRCWTLPAREYVLCSFVAQNFPELVTTAINKAVKYSQLWLDAHGLMMEAYSPEVYPTQLSGTAYMELWIPAVPKQQITGRSR